MRGGRPRCMGRPTQIVAVTQGSLTNGTGSAESREWS